MLALALGSLLVCLVLAVPVLTGLGARRRGLSRATSLVSGLVFPVAWSVWYLRDEQPYRRRHGPVRP